MKRSAPYTRPVPTIPRARCEARTLFNGGPGPGQQPKLWTRCALGGTVAVIDRRGRVVRTFCRIHARKWREGSLAGFCLESCGPGKNCVCLSQHKTAGGSR